MNSDLSSLTISDAARLLVVDDRSENIHLLVNELLQHGYRPHSATNGQAALEIAQVVPLDLILLDIRMPGLDGYEVCRRLKADPKTRHIPVIFLSALDELNDKVQAFDVGGVDYITKPFQMGEVMARIRTQVELQRAKSEVYRLNGELEARVQQRTAELERANQQLQQEVSARRRMQEQLQFMAFHDGLTGLPNRALFAEKLLGVIDQLDQWTPPTDAGADSGGGSVAAIAPVYAVLLLDCDRFKTINDSLGHLAGDRLMAAVAQRLRSLVPEAATVSRFGGDEFTILLSVEDGTEGATAVAQHIQHELSLPFRLGDREVFVDVSIGIVPDISHYHDPEAVLRDVDTAMYEAKRRGRNRYQVFDAPMHRQALRRLQIENDLRLAIERREFQVYYQPIVSIGTGRIAGFEALARWHHGQDGWIGPGEFIPVAEETGAIAAIGWQIFEQACEQVAHWRDQHLGHLSIAVNVNLSVRQLAQPDLLKGIDRILKKNGLHGSNLKIEIVESALVDNAELAARVLQQLRARHIEICLDDFGTGYSSLSYLHRFPVDVIKIDRSFIMRIAEASQDLAIVAAIIKLSQQLGLSVVAEGIESIQQWRQLRSLQCGYGQGYYFSRPLDGEAATEMLRNGQTWTDDLGRKG